MRLLLLITLIIVGLANSVSAQDDGGYVRPSVKRRSLMLMTGFSVSTVTWLADPEPLHENLYRAVPFYVGGSVFIWGLIPPTKRQREREKLVQLQMKHNMEKSSQLLTDTLIKR